ncbi:hypothetical protein BRARA_I01338 [Brassica rapa]|uniref:Uncharacterized protein n=1 Tax=Brassica campestris TaxID=3711 RepID=A0A397Y3M4_BRACM|nr:hypothetical protein BRARA_I01338 [Brassica rapa]
MSQKMPREVLTLNQIMKEPPCLSKKQKGTTISTPGYSQLFSRSISGESYGFDSRPYSGPTLRAKKTGCGNGYSSENYPRY